jgi:riboflavin synthase
MFTGIIEGTGRVSGIRSEGQETRLRIEAPFLGVVERGASVAVDGVCLTAVREAREEFEAVLSPETLSRTTLGRRAPGDRVNLERSLCLGDRLGGHLVQGHVDGVGQVESTAPEGTGRRVRIQFPSELDDLIVMKGSVAVDGVSLTVASRPPRSFDVALIPETLEVTHLSEYVPGTEVNLEVDMMGRYVVEYLSRRSGTRPAGDITREDLARYGFVGKREAL